MNVAAFSFRSYEDFEACNEYMNIQPGETATSSDGMFTVMIKTERQIPPGTLVMTTKNGKQIYVRVITGIEKNVGVSARHRESIS